MDLLESGGTRRPAERTGTVHGENAYKYSVRKLAQDLVGTHLQTPYGHSDVPVRREAAGLCRTAWWRWCLEHLEVRDHSVVSRSYLTRPTEPLDVRAQARETASRSGSQAAACDSTPV